MKKIKASIIGGSGYVGGELLRLLLGHPFIEVVQVTSERFAGNFIKVVHPNLRPYPLRFISLREIKSVEVFFLCLPHGKSMDVIPGLKKKSDLIIDLSADLRLNTSAEYSLWYGSAHTNPTLLTERILGLPEIYRQQIKNAKIIATPGCMATASILALYPLMKKGVLIQKAPIIIEAKTGSSGSGSSNPASSLHAERSGVIRSFKPTGHRHSAEIIQELTFDQHKPAVYFSATGIEAVRGILATCQVFLKKGITEKDIWTVYREFSESNPFIRIVKEQKGVFRYPEPKILAGTNVCEIGFEKDIHSNRLVVLAAIDNLMKGASGQAVQCLNIQKGWDEATGLSKVGLHPI